MAENVTESTIQKRTHKRITDPIAHLQFLFWHIQIDRYLFQSLYDVEIPVSRTKLQSKITYW